MAKKGEKILTRNQVIKLGLDKVSVITADMLEGYTSIGTEAFCFCDHLTSIEIPDGITNIKSYAFQFCRHLTHILIPNSVTYIGEGAFNFCINLTPIKFSNSIINIGYCAFLNCYRLTSITIGNKEYKVQKVKNGKCKAYKAFNANMTCRDFQYNEGETYEFDMEPIPCVCGFHACLRLKDVFNYYCGKLGKDIVVHEVKLEGVSNERSDDSKVVAKKITIGKRIL